MCVCLSKLFFVCVCFIFFGKQGQIVCGQVCTHARPTDPKWQLITSLLHRRMSSFKSSVLHLSTDLPLSDSPRVSVLWSASLCRLHSPSLLLPAILYPFLPFPDVGKEISLSFDFYSPPPSSSNLVTRPWQVRKRKGACGKWKMGSLFM